MAVDNVTDTALIISKKKDIVHRKAKNEILLKEDNMPIESAKAYLERLKNDEEFREKVAACKDKESRAELVKAEGFDFTNEDIFRLLYPYVQLHLIIVSL